MAQRITTRCPACRHKYTVGIAAAGKKARCAKCNSKFRIPQPKKLSLDDQILEWLSEAEEKTDRRERSAPPPKRVPPKKPKPTVDRTAAQKGADQSGPKLSRGRTKPKLVADHLKRELSQDADSEPKKAVG